MQQMNIPPITLAVLSGASIKLVKDFLDTGRFKRKDLRIIERILSLLGIDRDELKRGENEETKTKRSRPLRRV